MFLQRLIGAATTRRTPRAQRRSGAGSGKTNISTEREEMTNKVQAAGGDVLFMADEEKQEIINQVNTAIAEKANKPFTGRTKRKNPQEG